MTSQNKINKSKTKTRFLFNSNRVISNSPNREYNQYNIQTFSGWINSYCLSIKTGQPWARNYFHEGSNFTVCLKTCLLPKHFKAWRLLYVLGLQELLLRLIWSRWTILTVYTISKPASKKTASYIFRISEEYLQICTNFTKASLRKWKKLKEIKRKLNERKYFTIFPSRDLR